MTLKKRLGSSTAWMSLAATGNSLVSFLIFIILSRILGPKDIGLVAFALIIVEFGRILVNAGFSQAIVQKTTWDNTYASTCFYLNIFFAAIVTVVVLLIGAPLISYYYVPEAGPIVKALSVIYFIEGLKAVHDGKLKREFAFRVIAFRTVAASIVSGIVGIYLVLHDFGVWALVWQQLTNHFLIAIITLSSAKWMPSMTFSRSEAKALLRFSSPLMFAQLMGNINNYILEILLGIFIGPAALGIYRVGGRALYILQDVVLKPFEYTALSALSRLSSLQQQAYGTLRLIRMSAYIIFPIFFGAAALSAEFIVLAFGAKWAASGNIMAILAIGVAPQVFGYNVNAALSASNNSKVVMKIASIDFVIACTLGFITVPMGITATAIGYLIRNYVMALVSLLFFKKTFSVGIVDMVGKLLPCLAASLIMFATVHAAKLPLAQHLPAALNIIILCSLGIATYFTCMITIFRTETKNFLCEGIELAPTNMRTYIEKVQRLIKLA